MTNPEPNNIEEVSFHVRYAETDAMGIVHHASYIVYFEEGRSHYIRQKGSSYAEFERIGYYLAVTDIAVKYVKAAHYDQFITVRCWLTEIKSRTMSFAYEIIDAETGDIFVRGTSKHICLDKEGHIARIPEDWRNWLKL